MTSFGFESTTDDVLDGIDLSGKRVLVTGASAGLGVETTRALAAHGASVTMAVRDLDKGAAAMEQILAAVPGAQLDVRPLDLADPGFERTPYDPWLAYGRAKTANVLCAVGLDQRYRDQGVRAFAVHPGGIHTELGRHLTEESLKVLRDRIAAAPAELRWKTVPQGAATSVYAATSPDLDGQGGVYLEDCHIAEITSDADVSAGVRAYALDPQTADALWDLSEELVG